MSGIVKARRLERKTAPDLRHPVLCRPGRNIVDIARDIFVQKPRKQNLPSVRGRTPRTGPILYRREPIVIILKVHHVSETHLFQITETTGLSGLFPCLGKRRQEHRRQDGDDGDNYQQFNQSKAFLYLLHFLFLLFTLFSAFTIYRLLFTVFKASPPFRKRLSNKVNPYSSNRVNISYCKKPPFV